MKNISDRLTIEEHNGKQFIFLDFKGLKERDMIALDNAHMKLQLVYKLPFLADFHNTYVTPGFMSNTKRLIELHKGIIEKGAFLGIDKIKSWILKGVVLVHGCNLKAFDTKEQAKYFLTGGNDNKWLLVTSTGDERQGFESSKEQGPTTLHL